MLICVNNDDITCTTTVNPDSSFCIIAFAEYKTHLLGRHVTLCLRS